MGETLSVTNPQTIERQNLPSSSNHERGHRTRAVSWTADHVATVPGLSEAARYPSEYGANILPSHMDLHKSPDVAPSDPTSSTSSITPTPAISQRSSYPPPPPSPLAGLHPPSTVTPLDPPDIHPSETRDRLSLPTLAGTSRTAGNRSSGSSGSGDSITAKSTSKRVKQTTQRNLFGSLHVPAVRVIAPEGDLGMWFLFTVSLSMHQIINWS